jgi:signal transduction histidine kinase
MQPMSSPPAPGHGRRRLLDLLWSELRVALFLCLGVALFLTLTLGGAFTINLVYSLCIGLSIQGLIGAGRWAFGRWAGRDGAGRRSDWPGWPFMAPWIVVSVLLGYAFGALIASVLTGTGQTNPLTMGNLRALRVILPIVLVVSAGTTYYFYSRGRLAAIEAQVQAARSAAAEHQLRLLESQLEPHMLFNTLANLRVLIATDPPRAQAMLDRLIAFLRATLNASRSGRHTLAAEFERLEDYLALMGVRMGARLQSRLDLPEPLRDTPVPPLLLQPLVENSIKHGLEPKIDGGRIEVDARREGDMLVLSVRDTGVGLPADAPPRETGFGLVQVRERLATLYGKIATLTIEPADDGRGGTVATLRLPWTPA